MAAVYTKFFYKKTYVRLTFFNGHLKLTTHEKQKETPEKLYGHFLEELRVKGAFLFNNANKKKSCTLTLSQQRSLSYRNHSVYLLCKPMEWFLYDRDLRHERVKYEGNNNT